MCEELKQSFQIHTPPYTWPVKKQVLAALRWSSLHLFEAYCGPNSRKPPSRKAEMFLYASKYKSVGYNNNTVKDFLSLCLPLFRWSLNPTRRLTMHLNPRNSVCCLGRRWEDSVVVMFHWMAVISVGLSYRAQALPGKTQSLWGRLSILSQFPGTLRNTLHPGGNQCYGNGWDCSDLASVSLLTYFLKCTEQIYVGCWWKWTQALWG